MEEKLLQDISYKISALIGLVAEERIKDLKGEEKVDYLNKLGLEREIIAVICGVKTKSVIETLSRIKAKEKKGKRNKKEK